MVHGTGALAKRGFLQEDGLGAVTAISTRRGPAGQGVRLTIVGRAGAVLANARGQVERRVSFGNPGSGECLDRMEPVTGPEGEPSDSSTGGLGLPDGVARYRGARALAIPRFERYR